MKLNKLVASFCVGASLLLGGVSSVQARELKLAVGLPPSHATNQGLEVFAKTLKEKTNGELEVKTFALSLLSLTQMLAGVRDGVVDIGYVAVPLFPADLPEVQLPVDLAMLGVNGYAMAGAMTEYNFTCQECLAERLKQNNVYLGSASTATYMILATKKISTLDELKGKKLRSGAAPWSRWASHMGVVAATIPGSEVFEAVNQGTVDGAMMLATDLAGLRLIDVVKHVTVGMPGGTYHGQDITNVNRTTWRSLTESQRRAFLDSAAVGAAAITWRVVSDTDRSIKEAQAKGIQIHQPAADAVARSKAFVDADLATVAQDAEKKHGIKNAAQKIARFRQLVEKWEKLTPANVNWEPGALAEIYRREIYSKIDAKTYGM